MFTKLFHKICASFVPLQSRKNSIKYLCHDTFLLVIFYYYNMPSLIAAKVCISLSFVFPLRFCYHNLCMSFHLAVSILPHHLMVTILVERETPLLESQTLLRGRDITNRVWNPTKRERHHQTQLKGRDIIDILKPVEEILVDRNTHQSP